MMHCIKLKKLVEIRCVVDPNYVDMQKQMQDPVTNDSLYALFS